MKLVLNIPTHLKHVTTLPWWNVDVKKIAMLSAWLKQNSFWKKKILVMTLALLNSLMKRYRPTHSKNPTVWLTGFKNHFTSKLSSTFVVKWSLNNPPHLKHYSYTTLWFIRDNHACFRLSLVTDIDVSQGSVATRLRCGGVVGDDFTANLLTNLSVKEFWKLVNIWRSYGHDYSGSILWLAVSFTRNALWNAASSR